MLFHFIPFLILSGSSVQVFLSSLMSVLKMFCGPPSCLIIPFSISIECWPSSLAWWPICSVLYPFWFMSCPRACLAMLGVMFAPRYFQRTLYMAFPGRFSVASCAV